MGKIVVGAQSASLIVADCLAGDAVGACVCMRGAAVGGRYAVETANPLVRVKMPAVGVISKKMTSTSCLVALTGDLPLASDVPVPSLLFVGLDGLPSATSPAAPAFVQVVGHALDTARMLVRPSLVLTKLVA